MIFLMKKNRNNKKLLAIENRKKTTIAKVAKLLSIINFDNKYSWAIGNADTDAIKNLELINIKKE